MNQRATALVVAQVVEVPINVAQEHAPQWLATLSMRIVLGLIVVAWGVSNRNGVVTLVAVLNWQPPANLVEMDPLGMTQKERANQQN